MSYIIKRNNRRYNSKLFESYEQARSYIRKKLRAQGDATGFSSLDDLGWLAHNNPSHSRYGFSIHRTC